MNTLAPEVAIEVLVQLDRELGSIDPDTRAIVGLRPGAAGTVALVDVELRDNGILEVADDVVGLVVVTAEQVASGDDVIGLTQLLAVLRDGTEIGVYRVSGDDTLRVWRTDRDPEDAAHDLRPRDVTSNTARRAFGLPSAVDAIDLTDIAARTWLVGVATTALRVFDRGDELVEVSLSDLGEYRDSAPLVELTDGDDLPTWDEVHAAAIKGELDLGAHLTVDPDHAAWLDCDAFAQVLDRTLPSIEELLGTLRITGDDELLAWAIDWLSAREWYATLAA